MESNLIGWLLFRNGCQYEEKKCKESINILLVEHGSPDNRFVRYYLNKSFLILTVQAGVTGAG